MKITQDEDWIRSLHERAENISDPQYYVIHHFPRRYTRAKENSMLYKVAMTNIVYDFNNTITHHEPIALDEVPDKSTIFVKVENSSLESRHDSTKSWIRSLEERAENSGAPQCLIDAIRHHHSELVGIEQIMDAVREASSRLTKQSGWRVKAAEYAVTRYVNLGGCEVQDGTFWGSFDTSTPETSADAS